MVCLISQRSNHRRVLIVSRQYGKCAGQGGADAVRDIVVRQVFCLEKVFRQAGALGVAYDDMYRRGPHYIDIARHHTRTPLRGG